MSTIDTKAVPANYAIRRARERLAGELIPREIHIEVTNLCNLGCFHCCVEPYRQKIQQDELSASEIAGIFKQLFEMGVLAITVSGGEPLCRPDIFDIMNYAKKQGLFLGLKTNGVLITESVADKLKNLDITGVHISLYGATQKTHEYVTGVKGSFEKAINAVNILHQRKIRVGIKASIMKCNHTENKSMADLAKKLGVSYSPDALIYPKFGQPGSADDIRLNDEQLKAFVLEQNTVVADDEIANPHLERHLLCSGGRTRCAISPQGEVFPCVLWRIPLGDLKQQSFKDIWFGEIANRIRAIRVTDIPGCTTCELVSYCARCPGLVYVENGDISGPSSESCRLARAIKGVQNDRKKESLH